jgi:hypothetical protein
LGSITKDSAGETAAGGAAGEDGAGVPDERRRGRAGRAAAAPVQRLRLTFTKEEPIRYIGHLDVVRLWERACRRAGLPLAYTLGFTPHPRLQFAAPLALGVTGEAEVLDVFLTERLEPAAFVARLGLTLPPGSRALRAREVPLPDPAVSARLRWAAYRVRATGGGDPGADADAAATGAPAPGSRWAGARGAGEDAPAPPSGAAPEAPWRAAAERLPPPQPAPPAPPAEAVAARIAALLGEPALPRQRRREGKIVAYDLRPLVLDLWLDPPPGAPPEPGAPDAAPPGEVVLGMRLRADPRGQGRPDEVALALGLTARRVHRVRIGLEDADADAT